MRFDERVPDAYFDGAHYRGRPADFKDKIISQRVELVKEIPDFINQDMTLLDIGCGNGASMFLLSADMLKCDGVEVENRHLPEFEDYRSKHHIDNCTFSLHDIEAATTEQAYDRLISFEVIEHLSDESKVSNYYKSLKPGGIAAISVPNKWWVFETHGARLPLLPWNRVPFFSWLPRPIHEKWANARIYTKGRIRKLLENAGFRVTKISYVTAPMDVLKDSPLKRFLLKYIFRNKTTGIPFLATSLFIEAHKD